MVKASDWVPAAQENGTGATSHKTAAKRVDVCSAGVRIGDAPMGDDDEIYLHLTYASHWDMDEAFCARMRAAIAAGLENAPVSVITTPGTKTPKYIPTEPRLPPSSLGAMDL
jgi:hypothetical protein